MNILLGFITLTVVAIVVVKGQHRDQDIIHFPLSGRSIPDDQNSLTPLLGSSSEEEYNMEHQYYPSHLLRDVPPGEMLGLEDNEKMGIMGERNYEMEEEYARRGMKTPPDDEIIT